jgi:basic amino acid/polyamine antiporter, APA family
MKLKRSVGLPLLTLYGLGNILGAGVYVLIGEVAGAAGYVAPLAFVLALVVAAFTAFSYMELSSRFPKTAAVPVYLHQAFGRPKLSAAVGLLMVAAGLVSAATLARGFVGYFQVFVPPAPGWLVILGVVGILTAFAVAGISQSARLAGLFTVLEVVGLLLVIGGSWVYSQDVAGVIAQVQPGDLLAPGVFIGAFLAFYAFIGFEDMVEVVEEVKNPLKTMPQAILLSLVGATILYILVIVSALLVLTPQQLVASSAPLADVFARATGWSPLILAAIGLGAIVNGILVQIIMGSRILYGLSAQGWISGVFGSVHQTVRTPVPATLLVAGLILFLALLVPLVKLAEMTSFLVLAVFCLVNVSLWVIKRRQPMTEGAYRVPMAIPVLGLMSAAAMLVSAVWLRLTGLA